MPRAWKHTRRVSTSIFAFSKQITVARSRRPYARRTNLWSASFCLHLPRLQRFVHVRSIWRSIYAIGKWSIWAIRSTSIDVNEVPKTVCHNTAHKAKSPRVRVCVCAKSEIDNKIESIPVRHTKIEFAYRSTECVSIENSHEPWISLQSIFDVMCFRLTMPLTLVVKFEMNK